MSELGLVSGKLQLLAIIGDPIVQVKAPLMINAAIADIGLPDTLMVPLHVNSEGLQEALKGLSQIQNFRGAIITMPHKQQILPFIDSVSGSAFLSGGCNVIRKESNGLISGTMLDGEGFVESLLKKGIQVQGKKVYLAGVGGAGSAIAYSLVKHHVKELVIYNRTTENSIRLIDKISPLFPEVKISPGTKVPESANIVINATSLGMGENTELPFSLEKQTQNTVVCDIVIFPEQTPLIVQAQQLGYATHTGPSMLSAQITLMLEFMLGVENKHSKPD